VVGGLDDRSEGENPQPKAQNSRKLQIQSPPGSGDLALGGRFTAPARRGIKLLMEIRQSAFIKQC
jgi:hypothetical protein